MIQTLQLRLAPEEAYHDAIFEELVAKKLAVAVTDIAGIRRLKESIDARSSRQIFINCLVEVSIHEPLTAPYKPVQWKDVSKAQRRVIIIGGGPAGLFAALHLIDLGIEQVIIETGKDVRARRRDLAIMNKTGVVNPDSNYCFGEGGAGTYSDGKLYTRSSKRGNIQRILQLFHQFGAPDAILYQSHPHIGTNKLPHIITAMRETILAYGGMYLLDQKVTDIQTRDGMCTHVITHTGNTITGDAVIVATGHSARDIYSLFQEKKWLLEAKPFALGVRIEHPQSLIDSIQYHTPLRNPYLPPAAYSLVEQVNNRGVFSFCMCPGGIIAPAATGAGELVVNGWSPSKRNNPFSNSGLVVQIEIKDAMQELGQKNKESTNALLLLQFQQAVEQKAFLYGGGNLVAPAQRMTDFVNKKVSSSLPRCSYIPGIQSVDLGEVLPDFVSNTLREGCKAFGKKMKGYLTTEAVLVATESRTSAPVRIPRDSENLCHPQLA
ncbi:MAG: FAD-binding protein, partial [Sediminibacterium sp.]|nr:FAD-binding protein [Sediminibacterium sp.]